MLIFVFLLVCLACSTGLVFAKGTIYAAGKGPGEVVYGSQIKYSAKSFMSDVYYEYYVDGKWTAKAPTLVGQYKVRACAKGSFNIIKTGKERAFSIVPCPTEVMVDSDELAYGDNPAATANLYYGDTIAENRVAGQTRQSRQNNERRECVGSILSGKSTPLCP